MPYVYLIKLYGEPWVSHPRETEVMQSELPLHDDSIIKSPLICHCLLHQLGGCNLFFLIGSTMIRTSLPPANPAACHLNTFEPKKARHRSKCCTTTLFGLYMTTPNQWIFTHYSPFFLYFIYTLYIYMLFGRI